MSSSSAKAKESKTPFPVGPAGRRELRSLLLATTNPAKTIMEFQDCHSLHSMMAKALGTVPIQKYKATRTQEKSVETLDTDSVMTFLSHLGVHQHDVHKRISDTLLKNLDDEIRKTSDEEPLLDLLKVCWTYSTTIAELRPVLWAVLKQLGTKTPLAVLTRLAERDEHGTLKHSEVYKPLPYSLKRLCWEADWDSRIPIDSTYSDSEEYLRQAKQTLLYETIHECFDEYTNNGVLKEAADRPFVATVSERRILTSQRRALTKTASSTAKPPSGVVQLTSGRAVSRIRALLCDIAYRPKLLYAVLSILMARHGTLNKPELLGGASHLHCSLVADLLLSAGGPLPKAYTHVLNLARTLDDSVQEGNLSDASLVKIQDVLKLIFQPDAPQENSAAPDKKKKAATDKAPSTAVKRQLNLLIISGLDAMKDADPRQLFLNPVTDAIAPGYSKIIKTPMSIVTMEQKVAQNEYNSISDWEVDVKLMYKNCIDYNRGSAGHWFRGEASRQSKVFREEIFAQARRLYQNEIAKRSVMRDEDLEKKRKAMGPEIVPLSACSKKRKKDKEEYLPSMPALASLLISDPFVVRIILARVHRELRRGVMFGSTIPYAHKAVPSLIQLLHIAFWSKQICAVRGKKYFLPSAGFEAGEDPPASIAHSSLRCYTPLLVRLLLEAEIDRRTALGGDLYEASQSSTALQANPIDINAWDGTDKMKVAVALVQGSLIQLCQPGNRNESSLAITFAKFSDALKRLSVSMLHERTFFICLTNALLRHKTKLPKTVRDAVIGEWIVWLQDKDAMISIAHESVIKLLCEWSGLGNAVLPRDSLLSFATQVVDSVDSSKSSARTETFASLWKSTDSPENFSSIKSVYQRMLKLLPDSSAEQWMKSVGIELS